MESVNPRGKKKKGTSISECWQLTEGGKGKMNGTLIFFRKKRKKEGEEGEMRKKNQLPFIRRCGHEIEGGRTGCPC